MYYRLIPEIFLRGWNDVPYAIYNKAQKIVIPISSLEFQALSLCNGTTNIDGISILNVHKNIIKNIDKINIIDKCDTPSPISRGQKYKKYDCNYIKSAHWSITGKCNYKCRHCYLSSPHAKFGELSYDSCIKIIEQLSDCGIMNLSITGGEPFVRNDFWKIIDTILAKEINITEIYTNGSFINNKILDQFHKRNIKPEFSISFDGVNCHDWLRGVNGSEKVAINALKLLNESGFTTTVEMALHKNNCHTIEKTVELLSNLGVSGIKITPISESGLWKKENGKYNLTYEELYDIYLNYIPKYINAGSPVTLILGGFFACQKGTKHYIIPAQKYTGNKNSLDLYTCLSSKMNIYISADGKLLPCIPMSGLPIQEKMPSIINLGLKNALNSPAYTKTVQTKLCDLFSHNSKCNNCEHKLICGGGCRASSMSMGNGYLGCDDSICTIFKGGYIEKIHNLIK